MQAILKVIFSLFLLVLPGLSSAQPAPLSALARLQPQGSKILTSEQGIEITFAISQSVPWRVRLMDDPARLILDVREVDWSGLARVEKNSPEIKEMRAGVFRSGWSRLILELDGPWLIDQSEMKTSAGGAEIRLRLKRGDYAAFRKLANLPEPAEWALPKPADITPPAPIGRGPIVVVLDAGHGGIDPGAERSGEKEADLMLTFARELKELLLRDGRFKVVMTREEDEFVPLENRISIARKSQAHLFMSLHADAIAEGEATGATIYTLSPEASDEAARTLSERHERDDILAGIDLSAQDDVVAAILMDMARRETDPRNERLSVELEKSMRAQEITMHRHPRQKGGFSVLKSPDIPSVLVELGFMSSPNDLTLLKDPQWRAKMAEALRMGILNWAREDMTIRSLRGG